MTNKDEALWDGPRAAGCEEQKECGQVFDHEIIWSTALHLLS